MQNQNLREKEKAELETIKTYIDNNSGGGGGSNVVEINDFRGTEIAKKVTTDGLYQFYGTATDAYNPCGVYVNSTVYNNKYYGFLEKKGTNLYVYGFFTGSTESFYLKTETTNSNWGGTENQNSFNIVTKPNGYSPDYFCSTYYTSITTLINYEQELVNKMAVGEILLWMRYDIGNNIASLNLERKYSANTFTTLVTMDYTKTNPICHFTAKSVTGEVHTIICHKRPCAPYNIMNYYPNKSIDRIGLGLLNGVVGNHVATINGEAIIPYASRGTGTGSFMDLIGGEQLDQRIDPKTSIIVDIEAFKQYALALPKQADNSFIINGWNQIASSGFAGVNGASPGFALGTGARFNSIAGMPSNYCLYLFDQAMSGDQYFVGLRPVDPDTLPLVYEAYYGAPSSYWKIDNNTNRITAIGNPQNRTLGDIQGDFDDIIIMSYDYSDIGVIDPISNSMSIEDGVIEAKISQSLGNALSIDNDGLYAKTAEADNVSIKYDTNSRLAAKISAVAGNKLEVKTDGLYVSETAAPSPNDTNFGINGISSGYTDAMIYTPYPLGLTIKKGSLSGLIRLITCTTDKALVKLDGVVIDELITTGGIDTDTDFNLDIHIPVDKIAPNGSYTVTVTDLNNQPLMVEYFNCILNVSYEQAIDKRSVDYYVDQATGDDTNTGLVASSPLATVQKAFDLFNAAYTASQQITTQLVINVGLGTYEELPFGNLPLNYTIRGAGRTNTQLKNKPSGSAILSMNFNGGILENLTINKNLPGWWNVLELVNAKLNRVGLTQAISSSTDYSIQLKSCEINDSIVQTDYGQASGWNYGILLYDCKCTNSVFDNQDSGNYEPWNAEGTPSGVYIENGYYYGCEFKDNANPRTYIYNQRFTNRHWGAYLVGDIQFDSCKFDGITFGCVWGLTEDRSLNDTIKNPGKIRFYGENTISNANINAPNSLLMVMLTHEALSNPFGSIIDAQLSLPDLWVENRFISNYEYENDRVEEIDINEPLISLDKGYYKYWGDKDTIIVFVDPMSGDDTNNGSNTRPVQTLGKAMDLVQGTDKKKIINIFTEGNDRRLIMPNISNINNLTVNVLDNGYALLECNNVEIKNCNSILFKSETGFRQFTYIPSGNTNYNLNINNCNDFKADGLLFETDVKLPNVYVEDSNVKFTNVKLLDQTQISLQGDSHLDMTGAGVFQGNLRVINLSKAFNSLEERLDSMNANVVPDNVTADEYIWLDNDYYTYKIMKFNFAVVDNYNAAPNVGSINCGWLLRDQITQSHFVLQNTLGEIQPNIQYYVNYNMLQTGTQGKFYWSTNGQYDYDGFLQGYLIYRHEK
ncbi:MAG: hypothetical protein CfClM3_0997 [Methanobrevibacter sp. CfCl-M3]